MTIKLEFDIDEYSYNRFMNDGYTLCINRVGDHEIDYCALPTKVKALCDDDLYPRSKQASI